MIIFCIVYKKHTPSIKIKQVERKRTKIIYHIVNKAIMAIQISHRVQRKKFLGTETDIEER